MLIARSTLGIQIFIHEAILLLTGYQAFLWSVGLYVFVM
jgi:hypothetical protein